MPDNSALGCGCLACYSAILFREAEYQPVCSDCDAPIIYTSEPSAPICDCPVGPVGGECLGT